LCGPPKQNRTWFSNRMRRTPEPTVPLAYIREKEWYCTQCDDIDKETKQVTEPTDKQRIFNRLLIRLSEDYDIQNLNIESGPNEIILRVKLPDFDMSELRTVRYKQETGFITVQELMELQRAGFRRPRDVPPTRQPKDKRILRERARQKMFIGEPR
jgi:hypothetical protein